MLRQIAVHRAELLGPWKHLGRPFILYAFVAVLTPALFLSVNTILHHMDSSAIQPPPYVPPPLLHEPAPSKQSPSLEPAAILMSRIDELSQEIQELKAAQVGLLRENERLQSILSAGSAEVRQRLGDRSLEMERQQIQQQQILALQGEVQKLQELNGELASRMSAATVYSSNSSQPCSAVSPCSAFVGGLTGIAGDAVSGDYRFRMPDTLPGQRTEKRIRSAGRGVRYPPHIWAFDRGKQ